MKRRTVLFAALALAAALGPRTPQARADAPARMTRDTSADNELLLADDSLVVSASKHTQRISDSPAAVTVITADDIRRSGLTNIPDLLRAVPGVDVFSPNQSQQNVAIRGFNYVFANRLLVMVDGRPIYDTAYGNVFWNTQPLLLSQIARIEVVRGPGSALYGANAFDGVVNIITETPQQMAAEEKATFVGAAGEHRSLFAEATASVGLAGGWAATVGAGDHATAGYGGQGTGQVKDSSRVPIITADVEKALPEGDVRLTAGDSDARGDLTAQITFPDAQWHTSYVNLAYGEDRGTAPISARVSANFFRLIADTGTAAAPDSWSNATYDMDLQQQRSLSAAHHLVYGVGYRVTRLTSALIGGQSRAESLASGYLQDEWRLAPATSLFAGLRWDQNSLYGAQVSPRVSLVHHPAATQTLRLSYGQAFRAPSLLESFARWTQVIMPGVDEEFLGNTDLRPERISSVEAGWRRDLPRGYIGLSVFENHVSSLIAFSPTSDFPSPPFPAGTPSSIQTGNGGTEDLAGLELEGEARPTAHLRVQMNYSFRGVVSSHGIADDMPRNLFNVIVQDDVTRRIAVSVIGHYVDATPFGDIGTVPAYVRADAKIGYRVGGNAELALVGTNLIGDGHREYPNTPAADGGPQTTPQRRTVWVMFSTGLR